MLFKKLQVRYQTARSLPAPYAYFYTLTARSVAANALQIDLSITYPDRDDIDDDELIAEGYTRDDDFAWSGQLPKAWLQTLTGLVDKTRFTELDENELGEDDEFWEISVETDGASPKRGKPKNADDWQYLMQELIQTTYETTARERPFSLIYLDIDKQTELDIRLIASFAERTVQVSRRQQGREQTRTVPWSALQRIMGEVYSHDYETEEAQLKRPKRDGQWLNLGTEEWYDIQPFGDLSKLFKSL